MTLSLADVSFAYAAPVLTGFSLEVHPGETVGLTGPSGVGKTTAARIAALLLAPDSGTVSVDGVVATGVRERLPRALRGRVALLQQSSRLAVSPRMTLRRAIAEPLDIRRAAHRDKVVDELAERVGITPDLLNRRPHEVSDGQLQRCTLARALAQQPSYLVCDEPTASLDPVTTAATVAVLRAEAERGVGVLVVSHDRELLDVWADRTTPCE
ncbi:ATP-binding cassette domain-containing protein [Rhodococcus sp. HNM0569]|uniref:ABC transporter ATP-binding protein n=1 Tax=Rhodococcus sp. HNM0569 TaxID=2716340 RepID=UPI003211E4CF